MSFKVTSTQVVLCNACGHENQGIPREVLKDRKLFLDCVQCGQLIVSPKPRSPPKVKRMEKEEVTIMQPYNDDTGYYHEVTITKNLWKCLECGLVWQMRDQAETCKTRGHIPQFPVYYGGRYENGKRVGAREYIIYSVRKELTEKVTGI